MDGGAALCMGAVVIISLLCIIAQLTKIKYLNRYGVEVTAHVTSIWRTTDMLREWPDNDDYRITAQWTNPRTGQAHTFKWSTSRRPRCSVGSPIQVVFDPVKTGKYYIKKY